MNNSYKKKVGFLLDIALMIKKKHVHKPSTSRLNFTILIWNICWCVVILDLKPIRSANSQSGLQQNLITHYIKPPSQRVAWAGQNKNATDGKMQQVVLRPK